MRLQVATLDSIALQHSSTHAPSKMLQILAYTIGTVGLQAYLVSSFAPGPVTVTPPLAFVAKHPYRHAVDSKYPLRTPIGFSAKPLLDEGGDALLTPETYADSDSAEHEVENIIIDTAADAFQSTDFTTQPHLPPELENCEIVYEDDVISADDEETMLPVKPQNSSFQRSLLAQQLAYKTKRTASIVSTEKQVASKSKEAFQRSLLAARINNDKVEKSSLKSEEEFLQKNSKMSWMESEVRAASLGGKESVPFYDAAAMATRCADLADADSVKSEAKDVVTNMKPAEDAVVTNENVATNMTSVVATKVVKTAKRMIMEQDLALTNYVTKKGVEQTKQRMRQKLGVGSPGETNAEKDSPRKKVDGLGKKLLSTDGKTMLQKFLQTGLVQRLRQPKVLIILALVAILCRSLALAWFGNPAMRLK